MSDLHELSAVDALARMRTKEISPVELLDAVLARAAAVEGTVNAFTETREEEAAAAARASAERYARGEISREEFLDRRRVLLQPVGPPSYPPPEGGTGADPTQPIPPAPPG